MFQYIVSGTGIAVLLQFMQWLQVRRLVPGFEFRPGIVAIPLFLRLFIFSAIAILAFRSSTSGGLIFFFSYWMTRSIGLVIIGRTRPTLKNGSST